MEKEVQKSLISCIVSRKGGVPLHEINNDFKNLTGYSIPFLSLGHPTLLAFLSSIKNVYFVQDEENNDVLIVDSAKSQYMKKLVEKQKPVKRKRDHSDQLSDLENTISSIQSSTFSQRNSYYNIKKRKSMVLKKKTMDILAPIVYGHQLMGDDIFLEVAEHHLMVSVNETAPKRCGLCITGQTIKDLIDNIDIQNILPSRVAILIGLTDLLNEKKANEMINDMDLLISELKSRNINATLFTLPILNCIPKTCYSTLRTFNDYIISQEDDTQSITVMNLEHFYGWMTYKDLSHPKNSGKFLHETERTIILSGIQFINSLRFAYSEE